MILFHLQGIIIINNMEIKIGDKFDEKDEGIFWIISMLFLIPHHIVKNTKSF